MNSKRVFFSRQVIDLFTHTQIVKSFSTAPTVARNTQSSSVDPDQFLRACTILFQQKNNTFSKIETSLRLAKIDCNHEFFLEVCKKFQYSYRPVYYFYKFTLTQPGFTHTSVTFNKMLYVFANAKNIRIICPLLKVMAERKLANDRTHRIALRALASSRELKRCVEYFHLINRNGYTYNLDTLNDIVEVLCKQKLVHEARYIVMKLKHRIKPNGVTYGHLICGFCDTGETIQASKFWNLMTDEGIEADVNVINKMIERFFKDKEFIKGLRFFKIIRAARKEELGLSTYSLMIAWLCKRRKFPQARAVFDEMQERGIQPDNKTLASLLYGLVCSGRISEAYVMVRSIEKPDISIYHALIKGLLTLRKVGDATDVFRAMIRKGCEPIMHTYIMLLQGHMGIRGEKGNHPLVNFDSIFVGGIVKAGKFLEATKFTERRLTNRWIEIPKFDYNKFLYHYSNEEGVVMFKEIGKKCRAAGLFDLADIFEHYGEKMTTRDRRISRGIPQELLMPPPPPESEIYPPPPINSSTPRPLFRPRPPPPEISPPPLNESLPPPALSSPFSPSPGICPPPLNDSSHTPPLSPLSPPSPPTPENSQSPPLSLKKPTSPEPKISPPPSPPEEISPSPPNDSSSLFTSAINTVLEAKRRPFSLKTRKNCRG